jgi:hypothetical protein
VAGFKVMPALYGWLIESTTLNRPVMVLLTGVPPGRNLASIALR